MSLAAEQQQRNYGRKGFDIGFGQTDYKEAEFQDQGGLASLGTEGKAIEF